METMNPLTPSADDSEGTESLPPTPPSTPTLENISVGNSYEMPELALPPAALTLAQGQTQSFQESSSKVEANCMTLSSVGCVINTETENDHDSAAITGAQADTGADINVTSPSLHPFHPPSYDKTEATAEMSSSETSSEPSSKIPTLTPAKVQTRRDKFYQYLVKSLNNYRRERHSYESTLVNIAYRRRSEVAKFLRSDEPKEREEAQKAIALLTREESHYQQRLEDLACREQKARKALDRELERRGEMAKDA